MHPAPREAVEEPGVHGAEKNLPPPRPLPKAGHVRQQPGQFGAGEVGVQKKPGALPEEGLQALGLELLAQGGRAPILPDDGVIEGPPRAPFKHEGGLPLVGEAQGHHLLGLHPSLAQGLLGHPKLAFPDLQGIVLHPARPRVELAELPLGHGHRPPLQAEEDGPAAGGALVQGQKVLHRASRNLLAESSGRASTTKVPAPSSVPARNLSLSLALLGG